MLGYAQHLGPATRRSSTTRPANFVRSHPFRAREEATETAIAHPLGREARLARIEAILMIADEPMPAKRLAEAADLSDAATARRLVEELDALYAADQSAFRVEEIAGGFQLLTRPAFHSWLTRLKRTGHDLRLTSVAMETLAVIAYRQPITRADVEAVRGVSCVEVIRQLMEKGLVRHAGRHNSLGRPQLYATTKTFLRAFGLKTLADLPEVESLADPKSPY